MIFCLFKIPLPVRNVYVFLVKNATFTNIYTLIVMLKAVTP
jgi:hypothetical protein